MKTYVTNNKEKLEVCTRLDNCKIIVMLTYSLRGLETIKVKKSELDDYRIFPEFYFDKSASLEELKEMENWNDSYIIFDKDDDFIYMTIEKDLLYKINLSNYDKYIEISHRNSTTAVRYYHTFSVEKVSDTIEVERNNSVFVGSMGKPRCRVRFDDDTKEFNSVTIFRSGKLFMYTFNPEANHETCNLFDVDISYKTIKIYNVYGFRKIFYEIDKEETNGYPANSISIRNDTDGVNLVKILNKGDSKT